KPWRRESLENLLARLQLVENHRKDVLNIVDGLIVVASESNQDNLRFMLHRVDTRTWETIEDKENNRVIFQSKPELPDDLQQIKNEFNEKHSHDDEIVKLYLWAKEKFKDNTQSDEVFSTYSDALTTAKSLLTALKQKELQSFSDIAVGTITTTASVCVRDVLTNLSNEDKEWCLQVILEAVLMHADALDGNTARDATDHYGSGVCAFVLPKLFDYSLDETQSEYLKFVLATALTHENSHVSAYAAKGVREFLWSRDYELASFCLGGVVEFARFRKRHIAACRFYSLKGDELEKARKNWNNLITTFRMSLLTGSFKLTINDISLESHSSWFIHIPFLMTPLGATDKEHEQLIRKIVSFLYDSEYDNHKTHDNQKIHHDVEKQIKDCLTEHVIYTKNDEFSPFKDLLIIGCSQAPSFIYSLKLKFDVLMEKEKDFDSIWALWSILAPELHKIALKDVNDRYIGLQNDLNKLLRGMLYSDCPWQGHETEETDMRRGANYLLGFARQSASNSHVFEALTSLMYHFHEVFFDQGVHILADKYSSRSDIITKQTNTAFYLEMSIGRYLQIENRGTLSRNMYNACLQLLTGVIETGSARAYYLREHLIRSRKISIK
ncbi:MAG: hypothetical protein ACKVJE_22390, partial [Pseudomonadales bacterium]